MGVKKIYRKKFEKFSVDNILEAKKCEVGLEFVKAHKRRRKGGKRRVVEVREYLRKKRKRDLSMDNS